MRWLVIFIAALAFLLIGWTAAQRSQGEEATKLMDLEKRLAEAEKKIAELERRVSELSNQVKQLRAQPKIIEWRIPFEWRVPEEWRGFGLPKPTPQPFVQPYYYPLSKQH
jgi:type VI protein secretion system component VasK